MIGNFPLNFKDVFLAKCALLAGPITFKCLGGGKEIDDTFPYYLVS